MKRISALIMVVALAFALVACGSNPIQVIENPTVTAEGKAAIRANLQKAIAYTESLIDTKAMLSQDQDDEGESSVYRYWSYEKEMPNADFSYSIDIDGHTITVGETTVKEMKAFGMNVETSMEEVEPEMATGIILVKDNKTCNVTLETNNTGKKMAIDNCIASHVTAYDGEFSLPFAYSGLDSKATLKDVVDKFGQPNSGVTASAGDGYTTIEMSYSASEHSDKATTDSMLTFYFNYDAANDTATLFEIDLRRETY